MDVRFYNQGSLIGIDARTQAAKDWIAENVQADGCMWLGHVLYAEYRYARTIADAMIADGFNVE